MTGKKVVGFGRFPMPFEGWSVRKGEQRAREIRRRLVRIQAATDVQEDADPVGKYAGEPRITGARRHSSEQAAAHSTTPAERAALEQFLAEGDLAEGDLTERAKPTTPPDVVGDPTIARTGESEPDEAGEKKRAGRHPKPAAPHRPPTKRAGKKRPGETTEEAHRRYAIAAQVLAAQVAGLPHAEIELVQAAIVADTHEERERALASVSADHLDRDLLVRVIEQPKTNQASVLSQALAALSDARPEILAALAALVQRAARVT